MNLLIAAIEKFQSERAAVAGEYAVLLTVILSAVIIAMAFWRQDIVAAIGAAGDIVNP